MSSEGYGGEGGEGEGEGEGNRREGRRMVVALDESERSFHALQWALNTLPLFHIDKLILLHAKLPSTGNMWSVEVVVSVERAQDRQIEAFMNKALDLCKEKQVKAETKVAVGDPREVICEVVEKLNADFLVIGSHGYGAIKRTLLGSVSDYCAHHAKCPVIIAKKPHKKH